jgi:hypothetical protein
VLVGTRKGAFILTSDGARRNWQVSGPHFAGWEIYHLKGSPMDPDRIFVSQGSGWFGQLIQRSDDGGKTFQPVDNKFAYDGVPGTHQWYDGTPHPWEFKRVWHLEPSLSDPDVVYAGDVGCRVLQDDRRRRVVARAGGAAHARLGQALAAGRRRALPSHDPARSDERQPDRDRDLGRRRIPVRRRRRDVEADQQGAALRGHPGSERRGRPLRPSHREPSIAARHPVHAEALAHHAQR